jgi:hypothetical protein
MVENWQNILILYIIRQEFRLYKYFLPNVFHLSTEEMHQKK